MLKETGITIGSRVTQIHNIIDKSQIPEDITPEELNKKVDTSPVRCLDASAEKEMISTIDKAKAEGDSVGGVFEIISTGLPYGLGSYTQWDKKLQWMEKSLLFQRLPTSIKKTCCLRTFVVRENVWFWWQKVEGV